MNVLFLSIGGVADLNENAVYPDLLRCFRDSGHSVCVVCQREKRMGLPTQIKTEYGIQVLRVQTGNITKVGLVEKGISMLLIGSQFKRAIDKNFPGIKFDLILYSTPPITLASTIAYIKKRDKAFTYLMLKDIFPQNALDIGLLSKSGLRGIIYRYFKHQEKKLYSQSDIIGCMSEANVQYLKNNNKDIDPAKVEVCPNTINPLIAENMDRNAVRNKFGFPNNKTVFVYGGNFGKPQDVDYIIEVLISNTDSTDRHFVMCGSGTDFYKIRNYVSSSNCTHVTVIDNLNKYDYGQLLDACDVGLIFLDYRFTIPNFPSRLLDYMNHSIPVLAATDRDTDVGKVILDGHFGWWCESNGSEGFKTVVDEVCAMPVDEQHRMGANGRKYLETNFTTKHAFETILKHFK